MSKIKVLVTGDYSLAHTGYAHVKYSILKELFLSPDFEVAEAAYFMGPSCKAQTPWKSYSAFDRIDDKRLKYFEDNWDMVVMDFKPDIVFSPIDPYMCIQQVKSPLRDKYKLVMCAPLDREPVQGRNLSILQKADRVYGHCQWNVDMLNRAGIKTDGIVPIGIPDDFRVRDRSVCREELGFEKDWVVFGCVGRNHDRKRLPELMEAFAQHIKKQSDPSKYRLYLHTNAQEGNGWNLRSLLIRLGIADKVLFPYVNMDGEIVIRPFCGDVCHVQGNPKTFIMANSNNYGISYETMAKVYSCLNYYIQAAESEGFGIPPYEAIAAGIPVAAPNSSAMGSFLDKFKSTVNIPFRLNYSRMDGQKAALMFPEDIAASMELLEAKNAIDKLNHPDDRVTIENYREAEVNKKWMWVFRDVYKEITNPNRYDEVMKLEIPQVPAPTLGEFFGIHSTLFGDKGSWEYLYEMMHTLRGVPPQQFVQVRHGQVSKFNAIISGETEEKTDG